MGTMFQIVITLKHNVLKVNALNVVDVFNGPGNRLPQGPSEKCLNPDMNKNLSPL